MGKALALEEMNILDELKTDGERADALQSILLARATGEDPSDQDYRSLRTYFVQSPYAHFLPAWLRSKRSLGQFWPFIKTLYGTYRERRAFIYDELSAFIEATEKNLASPVEKSMAKLLGYPSHQSVVACWHKCADRVRSDPEGAVTAARTLIESVLKHIVSDLEISIEKKNPDLSQLYAAVAKRLSLSPKNHNETLIKGILSGCNSVVSGIGDMRNFYGDAHGKDQHSIRLESRHAHLAVNLAGSMALFLIATFEKANKELVIPPKIDHDDK